MKVGQWARFEYGYNYIGVIKRIADRVIIRVEAESTTFDFGLDYNIKTADNIEDLLEVGDIVIYKPKDYLNQYEFYSVRERIIRDKNQLEYIKEKIKGGIHKITAIELHENRVNQKISNE